MCLTEQEKYIIPTEWSKYRLLYKMLDLANIPRDAYCCEIGCGVGIFLACLEKKGLRSVGIDLSPEAVEIAQKRFTSGLISVRNQNIYDLKDKFDAIFMFEVLEHIEDDQGFLNYVSENLLKEKGSLFISVPARQKLFSRADLYCGHLRRYEKKDLSQKLREAGLNPLIFWSFGLLPVHLVSHHLLFRKFVKSRIPATYSSQAQTESSGLMQFPKAWKMIYPFASKFYGLVLLLEKAFLNLDIGYSYLVYCRKG